MHRNIACMLLLMYATNVCYHIECMLLYSRASLYSSVGKESSCNAGGLGLTPGLGRSPGEGSGNLLQSSCLENPMDREPGGLLSMGLQELDTT